MTRLTQTPLKLLIMLAVLALTSFASAASDDEATAAARDFRSYCAPCHGLEGRGDGPVAAVLKTTPSDLTLISRGNGGTFPSDTVYTKVEGTDMPVAHGTSEMPVWGLWFTGQAVGESLLLKDARPAGETARRRIRALVGYIETIQE